MKGMLHDKTVCYGTGSGAITPERATVVFVHGAGFDHAVWVMPARYFARHKYNVVAPDLPAHGGSAGPALASVEAMADWLHELLASLGVSRVTVVGHSMGSLVALAYAQRYAGEVEGIALLGTASPMTVGPVLLDAAADNHPAAFAMANTWSHSHAPRLGASATPGLSNFNGGQRWLQRMSEGVYHADLNACNNFRTELNNVQVPALVITGDRDKMAPAKRGRDVADNLPQAQVVNLPGCGHAMLTEQPNAVLDALAAFVAR